jgi:pectate lyase
MKSTGIAIVVSLTVFLAPYVQPVHALTNAELIQQLLVQIQILQAELAKLTGKTPATSPQCTFTRLLYFSVKGDDVLCLQHYLKSVGYFTEIPNGRYGPYTMDAVSRWQHAHGIIAAPKEYGLWGEQSRALYTKKIQTPSPLVSVPAQNTTPIGTTPKQETTKPKTTIPTVPTVVANSPVVSPPQTTPASPPVVATPSRGELAVFPGAVGFGTKTKAGRGGKVIEVTTLSDSGPGSLREALLVKEPRIIVFKVGGTIELTDALYIHDPFVTVAGQTAPGDGITLKNMGLTILSHDVLIQNIRIRPGNEGNVKASDNDGVGVLGKQYGGDTYNVVLDHVSVSWAEDENISMIGDVHDVTISNSIISEALNRSRHAKETHSAGLLITDTNNFTIRNTVLAHNGFRNPDITNNYLKVRMLGELVNNTIYNWGSLGTELQNTSPSGSDALRVNIVGNTYRFGGDTVGKWPVVQDSEAFTKLYLANNDVQDFMTLITPEDIITHNLSNDAYLIVSGNDVVVDKSVIDTHVRANQFNTPASKNPESAARAYTDTLGDAGASKPRRDSVDARIIADVRNRTGKIIDDPENDVGGYPSLRSGTAPQDTDQDGMSDAWESSQGLMKNDASDGVKDKDGDGYTNVEEYLFSLL